LRNFAFSGPVARKQNLLVGIIPNPYEKRRNTKWQNESGPIVLRCPVTAEERQLIEQKMAQLPTQRIGAYLRKMAIDGYIIYTDTTNIKEFNEGLRDIGKNINQIAKRLNSGAPAYEADITEIQERLEQIWQLQRRILSNLL
jgi:Bacterial mobilisation protein (MobC).